ARALDRRAAAAEAPRRGYAARPGSLSRATGRGRRGGGGRAREGRDAFVHQRFRCGGALRRRELRATRERRASLAALRRIRPAEGVEAAAPRGGGGASARGRPGGLGRPAGGLAAAGAGAAAVERGLPAR